MIIYVYIYMYKSISSEIIVCVYSLLCVCQASSNAYCSHTGETFVHIEKSPRLQHPSAVFGVNWHSMQVQGADWNINFRLFKA